MAGPQVNQPRDDSGQWVSIGTLFEREHVEHAKEHEQERQVAKDTAQRLEREVEETALRLERAGELTAARIEAAVATALAAVKDTARVHAEAHGKEHLAHERIHAVEEANRDKASAAIDRRLEGMNEFRKALEDQSARSVTRDMFDQRGEGLTARIVALEKSIVGREAFAQALDNRDQQLDALNTWRSKATGAAVVLTLCASAIGAAIVKIFLH